MQVNFFAPLIRALLYWVNFLVTKTEGIERNRKPISMDIGLTSKSVLTSGQNLTEIEY